MASYKIVRATMADRLRVTAFLREAYFKHEPLNIALGSSDNPSEEEIGSTMAVFAQGMSLLALSNDNKLVGVIINGEVTKNETDERQRLLEICKCKDFAKLLKYSLYLERKVKFWTIIDEQVVFNGEAIAIDPKETGQGIGKMLAERSEELAKESGYKLIRNVCTSYYAGRVLEQLGMTCVFEEKFEDYKDENSEVVFKVPAPHKSVRAFIRKI